MKSSTFSTGFRGISQLGSAFIFLRWFKLAHICIQVTSLHKWKKQGINHKLLIGNRFHVTLRIVSPIILFKFFRLWSEVTWIRIEKSAFDDQSEEKSVWIIKWTTLLGIFCKIHFTPTVTFCYHVHADAHLSVALMCYLDATGAETSMLLKCILQG